MTRDLPPERQDEEPPRPSGYVRVTGPGPLVVIGLAGMFLGWAWRGQAIRTDQPTPMVPWLLVGVTWFVAAVVVGIAFLTWRTVRRNPRLLTVQQGLSRLVLGKTIARIGAFAFGGFLGTTISNLNVGGDAAQRAILHALVAAAGAGVALAAGLLLEHACRVPPRSD
ncbi:MAG: DUF3180 domain-containing protein [Nocardioidaceae bacterium]|nr:DUF3180 domain-containing protein [Nocardioidaceae bacterium]